MRRESPQAEDFDEAMTKVLDTLNGLPVTITATSIENMRNGFHTQMNIEGELEVVSVDHKKTTAEQKKNCLARVLVDQGTYVYFRIGDIQTVIVYPEEEVIKREGIQAILYIHIHEDKEAVYQIDWKNRLTKYLN